MLADYLGAYVWGVDAGEWNMDTTHPCYRGQTGHMFGENSKPVTQRGDIILVCGTYMLPEVYPSLDEIYREDAVVVHIDWDSEAIAKNHHVDMGIIGHPKQALSRLNELVRERVAEDQIQEMRARREEIFCQEPDKEQYPQVAAAFLRELSTLLPNAVIFDEERRLKQQDV